MPRRAFLFIAAFLSCCLVRAQAVVFDGALSSIKINRYSSLCSGQPDPAVEVLPAAASTTVKFEQSCKGSSLKLEFTLNLELKTAAAKQASSNELEFEEGIRGSYSATAMFAHPKASGSVLKFEMPARDLDPSSGFPVSAGACTEPIQTWPGGGGEWTRSLSIPECTRNKRQFFTKNADGSYTVQAWTEIHAYLWADKDSTADSIAFGVEAVIFYRLTPNLEKVRITSITPEAGKRQDPNGVFQESKTTDATVEYELVSQDEAQIALVAVDSQHEVLLGSSDPQTVKKGTGTVRLQIPPFAIPRNTEEIQIGAILGRADTEQLLAQSEPVKYPAHIELSIPHVEVFQVVQDENNSIPLVANRLTVLEVPLVAEALNEGGGEGVAVKVRARRNGKEIEGSPYLPNASGWDADTGITRGYIGNATIPLPMSWTTAGILDLELEVNPAGPDHLPEHSTSDNTHNLTVEFEERPSLNIRYIQVCVEAPGEAAVCPEGSMGAYDTGFVAGLFPLAPAKLGYGPVSAPTLTWKQPMVTVADWDQLLVEMQALVERSNAGGETIDQLVVWLPAATRATFEDGKIRALSMNRAHNGTGRVALVPVQSAEELDGLGAWVVAHEIGHNFGLEHGYPPPACAWNNSGAVTGELNLNFETPLLFLDTDTYHFMSSCVGPDFSGKGMALMGIQPDQYLQLWQSRFQPWTPASTKQPAKASAETAECALLQGVVESSGQTGRIERLTRIPCAAPPKPVAGGYCIRMESSSGAKLDETCFGVSFTAPDSAAQMKSRAYFVNAKIPPDTARIGLYTAEGRELASRQASASAPSVAFVTPKAGDQWNGGSGPLEIKWAASDPEGGSVTFVLDYSADGGVTWTPLLLPSPSEASYALDASRITGGKKVHFRVTASDGFLQSTASAGPVEIVQTPVAEAAASLDFLNAILTRPAKAKVEIRNTGSGPLTLQAFEISDPFAVTEPAPVSIPAGTKRKMTVVFTPVAKGLAEAVLHIRTNDPVKAVLEVALSGTGVDASTPDIEAIPATLSFGNVVNGKNRERTLQVRNRGPADLTVRAVQLTANAGGLFTATPLAKPVVLKQGESQEVKVTFAPRESGSFTGKLTIESDDPKDGALQVPLTGSGVATASPVMRVQPAALAFGNVTVGASKDMSATLSNPGGAPLVVTTLSVTGGSAFAVRTPVAPFTIEAGFDATVTVRFAPDSAGAKSGSLVIAGNDAANPAVVVALSGTGGAAAPAPKMEIGPAALSFGDVVTGQTKTLPITIRNRGDAVLSVVTIASSNVRFGIANGVILPLSIAAGAETQVGILFSPVEVRAETGTLTISGKDVDPVTVALSGSGVAPPASQARITVDPAGLSFGAVQAGQSRDLTLTVRNSGTGSAQLRVSAASITGSAFRLIPDFSAFALDTGASRTLTVRFLPGTAGDFAETLNISSNDSSTPVFAVSLRGAGQAVPPPSGNVSISVTPSKLEFGALLIGQSRSVSFNIVATGTTPLTVTAITSSNAQVTLVSPALPVSTSIVNIIPVTVKVTAATAGALNAILTIASNASNDPALAIPMSAAIYAPGTVELAVDDGTFERMLSRGEMFATPHYVNRLTPPVYPATIRTVRIYFHDKADGLEPRTGITVVSGANEGGTENINQTPFAKVAAAVPATLARWADFAVTPLTIQSGDFVAGFFSANGEVPFTVGVDTDSTAANRSYVSNDGRTFQMVDPAGKSSNFGIRIVVTLGNP
jgi:hypothetical protein